MLDSLVRVSRRVGTHQWPASWGRTPSGRSVPSNHWQDEASPQLPSKPQPVEEGTPFPHSSTKHSRLLLASNKSLGTDPRFFTSRRSHADGPSQFKQGTVR